MNLINADKIVAYLDIEYEFEDGCRDIENIEDIPSAFEGMTNGEVIQALFPEARKSEFEYTYSECIKLPYHTKHDTGLLFDKDWWNTPYKAESEDE